LAGGLTQVNCAKAIIDDDGRPQGLFGSAFYVDFEQISLYISKCSTRDKLLSVPYFPKIKGIQRTRHPAGAAGWVDRMQSGR
jgi:hypothetical protein